MATALRIPPDWHLRSRLKARQLALLVALAERKSLRQAADVISVSQPAATKMLHDLEDVLSVPLFQRHPWGMETTLYGETMVRYARGVLTDLAEARDELAAIATGAKGTLRVGGETGAVPRLVVPAIVAVRKSRPDLKLFILVNASEVLAAGLRQGTLEVAVGPWAPSSGERPDLKVEALADEPLCVVARANHRLARQSRVSAVELSQCTWILQPPDTPLRQAVESLFARRRVRLAGNLIETVSVVATLALLQVQDALSVLPMDLARYYEEHGLLARLSVALPPGGSPYVLITRANRQLSPAALAFVEALQSIARNESAASAGAARTRPRGKS